MNFLKAILGRVLDIFKKIFSRRKKDSDVPPDDFYPLF